MVKLHRKKLVIVATVLTLVVLGIFTINYLSPKTDKEVIAENSYVGDSNCRSCHASEYQDWKTSDHFKAMMPANDSTVLGDFTNTSFKADGITSRFFKRDSAFYINTEGPGGNNTDYKILFTFGHYPLQQYLVALPGGRLQALRQSWDSKQKKWFHQYAGRTIDNNDWLHWTGNAQNWNTMCASCHSTNLKKNYNLDSDSYHTTYAIINASCESCHGPGKQHVDYINSANYKQHTVPGAYMAVVKGRALQINSCMPCHSLRSEISNVKLPSGELLDDYILQVPTTEHYYADGQMKEEVFTQGSFLQSKMYKHGVTCTNCHNPHTGKLSRPGNLTCTPCHTAKYDDPSHHFHGINTEASQCKSCHMPGEYYMGNDYRHDHSFRVPRPDLSVKFNTPNACNNCHTEKSFAWTASAIQKWYGNERKYHFAEDLIPGSKIDPSSEKHLVKLLQDTATPAVIKASALFYLGSINSAGSSNAIINEVSNPDAFVRYTALRSLANFPLENVTQQIISLTKDKVRAVRIAAADLLLTVPSHLITAGDVQPVEAAKTEHRNYLLYQADFAAGNAQIGDYYLRLNDYNNAEKFYLRSLRKDSLMNYSRLNLASVYSAKGKNDEALRHLRLALAIDNKNDRIYYNMALLYTELNRQKEAIAAFEKAIALKSKNPSLYYNYGLLLQQHGNIKKAGEVLLKGITIDRYNSRLNYAIAFVYLQQNALEKAKPYVLTLKQLDGNNPQYTELFRMFGL